MKKEKSLLFVLDFIYGQIWWSSIKMLWEWFSLFDVGWPNFVMDKKASNLNWKCAKKQSGYKSTIFKLGIFLKIPKFIGYKLHNKKFTTF